MVSAIAKKTTTGKNVFNEIWVGNSEKSWI